MMASKKVVRTENRTMYRAADDELLIAVYQRTDNMLWVMLDFTGRTTKTEQFTNRIDAEAQAGRKFRKA